MYIYILFFGGRGGKIVGKQMTFPFCELGGNQCDDVILPGEPGEPCIDEKGDTTVHSLQQHSPQFVADAESPAGSAGKVAREAGAPVKSLGKRKRVVEVNLVIGSYVG